jgi:hypothetical protein
MESAEDERDFFRSRSEEIPRTKTKANAANGYVYLIQMVEGKAPVEVSFYCNMSVEDRRFYQKTQNDIVMATRIKSIVYSI